MHIEYLTVKRKTLAAEARIIRKMAQKAKKRKNGELAMRLNEHRTDMVRKAARTAHLSHAFIKGMEYRRVERIARTEPDLHEINRLVSKYGKPEQRNMKSGDRMIALEKWKEAAVKGEQQGL